MLKYVMQQFLESEIKRLPPEQCLFHVIPAPLEKTVSYGKGAAYGPAAIIEASNQLEVWTGSRNPSQQGIYTWPAVDCSKNVEQTLDNLEKATLRAFQEAKRPIVPVILGGEHSLTPGALRALLQHHERIGVIQIDAHADLKDAYDGTPYSHACAMRRVLELGCPLVQFGVRSLAPDEKYFREETGIPHIDARAFYARGGLPALPDPLLPPDFPEKVFITFDVDGLDPSVIPATGTPEPGGLLWYDALGLLERALENRTLVGFDVVELAPFPGLHWPNFAAARLTYELMALALEKEETES